MEHHMLIYYFAGCWEENNILMVKEKKSFSEILCLQSSTFLNASVNDFKVDMLIFVMIDAPVGVTVS